MGDLNIRVIEAKNLIPADTNGKSDPFVTVEILEDPLQKKQKTKVHHKTLNPIWNQQFNFRAPNANATILFKVWDHDFLSRNDPLGNIQVQVNRLIPNSPNNLWFDLQGVPSGSIHLEIKFNPFAQPSPRGQQSFNTNTFIPQPGPYQQQAYPQQQGQGNFPTPQQQNTYQPQHSQNFQQPAYKPAPAPASAPYYPPQQGQYGQQQNSYPQQQGGYPPISPRGSADVYTPSNTSDSGLTKTTSQPTPGAPSAGPSLAKSASHGSNVGGSMGLPPPPTQNLYPPNPSYPAPPPPIHAADVYAPAPQAGYSPLPPPPIAGAYQAGGPVADITQGMQHVNIGANTGLIAGPPIAKFFVDVRKRANRDYILIMDMSGSMFGQRWKQAKDATMKIAPFACQADPDGITLYLFNSSYKRFPNLTSAQQVQSIFDRERPASSTDLTGVLEASFREHFKGNKPTTILVITDGEPNNKQTVKKEIIRASQSMNSDSDLSISFIQIGNDSEATHFLKDLDDGLKSQGAKFDIVDTVPATALGSMSFDELIQRSIYD